MRPTGYLASLVVLAALGLAALVPGLRLPLMAGLLVGLAVAPRGSGTWWAVAAGIPVALILTWGSLVGMRVRDTTATCADPLSLPAWERVAEAFLVVGVIWLLGRAAGASLGDLGLRRPERTAALVGIAGIALIPIPSLYLGAMLAEPFFGRIELDLSQPAAILPAFTLAIANGTMEELAYRGALMRWTSRAATPLVGLVGQGIVFGLAHTGTDYTGSALPVVLVIAAGGLLAGLIARRTGSLCLPICVHIAFDVPLYYAAACRLG